jgi:DNA repair exonuclease SbcCD ATPase subunit
MVCSVCGQIDGHDLSCPMREVEYQKEQQKQKAIRVEESQQKPEPQKITFAEVEAIKQKIAQKEKEIDEVNREIEEAYVSTEKDIEQLENEATTEINRLEKMAKNEIEEQKAKAQSEIDIAKEKLLNEIKITEDRLNAFSSASLVFLAEIQPSLALIQSPNEVLFCFGKRTENGEGFHFQFGSFDLRIEFADLCKQLHEALHKFAELSNKSS